MKQHLAPQDAYEISSSGAFSVSALDTKGRVDQHEATPPREFLAYLGEPLAQRPAGSAGKYGCCSLRFAVRQGATFLQHSFVTHPFHLTRPWYSDPALPGMAVVYIQTPSGGLIQGDRAHLQFTLEAGAQAHLTTQAAEKIHSMTANCAFQQISFAIGAGAYAEYCPEPLILFPASRLAQHLRVELREGARFFAAEIFLYRRATGGEVFDALSSKLTVFDASGTLLVRDHSLVFPAYQDLTGPGILGSYQVWGQAWFVGAPAPPPLLQEVHARLPAAPQVMCGVSSLPGECGMNVKVVGSEVRLVRRALQTAWCAMRRHYFNIPAPVFHK